MTPDAAELALARRARTVDGLDLWSQREASPEVARAELRGAGQQARMTARARGHAKLERTYATLCLALAAAPDGLTRKELAHTTGLPVNTVNARISEMRARTDEYRVITDGRRDAQSICHLARLRPPLNEER